MEYLYHLICKECSTMHCNGIFMQITVSCRRIHVHLFQSSKTVFLICLPYELRLILSVDVDALDLSALS